jgi:hypothetical protein
MNYEDALKRREELCDEYYKLKDRQERLDAEMERLLFFMWSQNHTFEEVMEALLRGEEYRKGLLEKFLKLVIVGAERNDSAQSG